MVKPKKVVLNHEEQKKAKGVPGNLNREAQLSTANTRLFIVCILLGLVALYAIYAQSKASTRANNNIKAAWVKMYPNGTWDVEFHDEFRKQEFFYSTIDYIIKNWVSKRYSKIPESIDSNYGYCYDFMSPELQNDFVSPEGFDAPAKAADIKECAQCLKVKVNRKSIVVDHFDSDVTMFGKHEGALYRTNVFATLEEIGPDGIKTGSARKVIIPMEWRLKSVQEIQAEKDILENNPIGLEIRDYELLEDKTSNLKK